MSSSPSGAREVAAHRDRCASDSRILASEPRSASASSSLAALDAFGTGRGPSHASLASTPKQLRRRVTRCARVVERSERRLLARRVPELQPATERREAEPRPLERAVVGAVQLVERLLDESQRIVERARRRAAHAARRARDARAARCRPVAASRRSLGDRRRASPRRRASRRLPSARSRARTRARAALDRSAGSKASHARAGRSSSGSSFASALRCRSLPRRVAASRASALVAAAELLAVAVRLLEVEADHVVAALGVRVEPASEPLMWTRHGAVFGTEAYAASRIRAWWKTKASSPASDEVAGCTSRPRTSAERELATTRGSSAVSASTAPRQNSRPATAAWPSSARCCGSSRSSRLASSVSIVGGSSSPSNATSCSRKSGFPSPARMTASARPAVTSGSRSRTRRERLVRRERADRELVLAPARPRVE